MITRKGFLPFLYFLKETLTKVYSHAFGSGLKLTEHSYVGNYFVNVVANEIVENPANLYWVGDYSEPSDFKSEDEYNLIYGYAWNGNDKVTIENPRTNFSWEEDWYYINNTKKEYLLMPKEGDLVFSPIPLLTALGNGRGGGDYYYEDMRNLVGNWAGDEVLLSKQAPADFSDITAKTDFGEENGKIYIGKIKKEHIISYFEQEKEVIVDPKHIEIIKEYNTGGQK